MRDKPLPTMEDAPDKCEDSDCPGIKNWRIGYGLAGGGFGSYYFCEKCEKVIAKTQEDKSND